MYSFLSSEKPKFGLIVGLSVALSVIWLVAVSITLWCLVRQLTKHNKKKKLDDNDDLTSEYPPENVRYSQHNNGYNEEYGMHQYGSRYADNVHTGQYQTQLYPAHIRNDNFQHKYGDIRRPYYAHNGGIQGEYTSDSDAIEGEIKHMANAISRMGPQTVKL